MHSVSTSNPHPPPPQLRHPWHQTLCLAEWVLLVRCRYHNHNHYFPLWSLSCNKIFSLFSLTVLAKLPNVWNNAGICFSERIFRTGFDRREEQEGICDASVVLSANVLSAIGNIWQVTATSLSRDLAITVWINILAALVASHSLHHPTNTKTENGEKCESYFGAWTPWLAAWVGHELDGSAPHRFPSNLSTTTQRAIVMLRGAASELCALFIWSV